MSGTSRDTTVQCNEAPGPPDSPGMPASTGTGEDMVLVRELVNQLALKTLVKCKYSLVP